jgi:predicted AlkP superfamily pyrophosphatase or phosphodiesterase
MSMFTRRSLFLAALLVFHTIVPGAQAPRTKPGTNHVVIISLDGFPASALGDARLPLPNLRRLAAAGAVARGMRPVNPSVTWPNHTTMVTGVTPAKHGVLFNGVLIREPGTPARTEWRDKKEMVRVPTLYDVAHERGLTTAQVDWVAIQNAPTITWEFRERPEPKERVPQELVKAGVLTQQDLETFSSGNILWRDYIWTQAGAHILRTHRPNLLLFHLLTLDSTHHRYGPRNQAALNTMAYLDTQVGILLDALRDGGMAERATVFVVSDHGFKLVKRQIRPNAAFLKAGLLTADQGKVSKAQAWSVPEGGTAMVYVTVRDPSGQILAKARQALEGIEGIERVIEPKDYAAFGLPQPSANEQMGVLFLTAQDGYAFTAATGDETVVDAPAGSLGAHGYVGTDPDMQALFIASGRGIRRGAMLDVIDNVDLAPTAARLLGISLKDVDGKPLDAILTTGR